MLEIFVPEFTPPPSADWRVCQMTDGVWPLLAPPWLWACSGPATETLYRCYGKKGKLSTGKVVTEDHGDRNLRSQG